MKVYTKSGDKGKTTLYGGTSISKDDIRIEAYGTVDELNSIIGMLTSLDLGEESKELLQEIQNELFNIGSHLATAPGSDLKLPALRSSLVDRLEDSIDKMDEELPALKTFVLPGGSVKNGWTHLARAVCRRAERRVVSLDSNGDYPQVVIFLNRLSDYFFVLSRYVLFKDGKEEIKWMP